MKTLHGWVIMDKENKDLVDLSLSRQSARNLKIFLYPTRNYAIRKFEVIEPAPRRKKPVMMVCPKAETCKSTIGPHCTKHTAYETCKFSNDHCPACVEAR